MGAKIKVMKFRTLISVEGLAQFLEDPNWAVVDCRFWLDDTEKGRLDYKKAHIPGAIYAHLDEDLSGPVVPDETGRHPLPDVDRLAQKLGSWGIGPETQVVAYDDRGGMIAARLWWLLRWLGHETVAVLDGGYPAWVAEGHPITGEVPSPEPRNFTPALQPELVLTAKDVLQRFGDPGSILVDSRARERYRGEEEPIDPVAGRIPGAVNYFWNDNLDPKGHMQLKQVLRGRFESLFGDVPVERVTFYCGSGVTAAHNALAVAHSGLGMPRIYAGSWSEWIADPERPIATGK
jgi:thiosulfate/3-mercaptopyruvate sulfurtransferase